MTAIAMLLRRRGVLVCLGAAAIGCGDPSGPAVTVLVAPRLDSVVPGSVVVFSAELTGGPVGPGRAVEWTSSDPAVATVRPDGRAHALAPGVTAIAASVAGVTGAPATLVVVEPAAPTVIEVSPATVSIGVGGAVLFMARVVGASEGAVDVPYSWVTSNPLVAIVVAVPPLAYGLAIGLQPGTTQITAVAHGHASAPAFLTVVDTLGMPR